MNRKLIALAVVLAVLVVVSVASGVTVFPWSSGTFEQTPPATEAFSLGPERMRDIKFNTRLREEVEHQFGTTSAVSGDNGLHLVGSARCFMSDTAPTTLQHNDFNNAHVAGTGSNVLAAAETNAVSTLHRGHGRCWIDTDGADNTEGTADDDALYVWDEDHDGDTVKSDSEWVQITNGNYNEFGSNNYIFASDTSLSGGTPTTVTDSAGAAASWVSSGLLTATVSIPAAAAGTYAVEARLEVCSFGPDEASAGVIVESAVRLQLNIDGAGANTVAQKNHFLYPDSALGITPSVNTIPWSLYHVATSATAAVDYVYTADFTIEGSDGTINGAGALTAWGDLTPCPSGSTGLYVKAFRID